MTTSADRLRAAGGRRPPATGRAEIHFHLLPGVDDGPATTDEAVALAIAARRDGTTTIVATPHVHDVVIAEVPGRVRALQRRLDA